jgi:hypothetical protein
MHEYWNLPLRKQLSFNFLASFPFYKKEIISWEHGNIRTYIIGGAPPAYRPRVSSAVVDPSKMHIAIKRELSMFSEYEKKNTHTKIL